MLAAAVAVLLLAACSSDDAPDSGDVLRFGVITRGDGDAPVLNTSNTSTDPLTLFVTTGVEAPVKGIVTWNDPTWSSNLSVTQGKDYYFYGFSPENAATGSLSMLTGAADYSGGAVLTLTGVDAVSTKDLCVVTGVQGVENSTTAADVKLGKFYYLGKEKGNNFVHLLMSHLYASIKMQIKVDADYDALRTIKLKSMQLGTTEKTKVTLTVTLTANNTETNPITSSDASGGSAATTGVTIYESDNGVALSPTEPIELTANVLPFNDLLASLTLTSTYDVYDKKGMLIRENQTATNKLTGAVIYMVRGDQMTLNLTVKPTYLYQLSDKDLDNPTVVMN